MVFKLENKNKNRAEFSSFQATWPALGGCASHRYGRTHCCVHLNDHLPQNINGFQMFTIIFSRWTRLQGRVIRSRAATSEHQHASCIIIDETSVGANNPDSVSCA